MIPNGFVPRARLISGASILATSALVASGMAAQAAPADRPTLRWVGQIARQDVPALPGSEPDTLVEPDIGVSPVNDNIALAVSHDGRYPDGGAVGIETAWTGDGGRTWMHQPLPGITKATGGSYERASDPVVAYAANGTAYVSTLAFDSGCTSAVLLSKSTDGGRTFAKPTTTHRSTDCDVSDDKNWVVVDTGAKSPHKGRIYQFWTPFLRDFFGNWTSPQAVSWSDDGGKTWSKPRNVTPKSANTQNSQPMILANGTVVDTYIDYGTASVGDRITGSEAKRHTDARPDLRAPSGPVIRTAISTDGGETWRRGGKVTTDLGDGPMDVRSCLPSSAIDPVTGTLYTAWNSTQLPKVKIARSTDGGRTWSAPLVVNRPNGRFQSVNVDVAARGGLVQVSFGLTNADTSTGRFAWQYVAFSTDGGRNFGAPVRVGPRINYQYAAWAGGIFPGDYIGSAIGKTKSYATWAVSSKPANPTAKYHQVLYAAVFAKRH